MNDIEVLERFTKIVKGKDYNAENGWHGYYDCELIAIGKAIENLLKRNKELEKGFNNSAENEVKLTRENTSLKSRIKDLEERIESLLCDVYNHFIRKSLIKEKKKEIREKAEMCNSIELLIYAEIDKVLEELLKGE